MPSIFSRLYWTAFTVLNMLGQARYPFRSEARIRRDADRSTRRMVRYAYRWVPYYRETMDTLGLSPRDFVSVQDLKKLPLISAKDLQSDAERFRSRQFAVGSLMTTSSSGSTGRPRTIWYDVATMYRNLAHGERESCIHREIIGKGRRLRAMVPRNASRSQGSTAAMRSRALFPRRANMLREGKGRAPLSTDPAEVILAGLNERKPDLLFGYGSLIAAVFTLAHEKKLPVHRPAIVRYAADAMPVAARRLLTEEYGIQVFSAYQAVELHRAGFECEAHCGYHINADHYAIRIVDGEGNDCPAGVDGEIVGSNLVNRATVLLNYRMGDRAALLEGPCPCGRNLPMISFLQGRMVDMLYDTSGRAMFCTAANQHIRAVDGLYQYQVVQRALDHMQISLVAAESVDRDATTAWLSERLKAVFGQDMRVEVQFVEDIVRTPAGKTRFVQSFVDKPED